jgi:hypothetical protein
VKKQKNEKPKERVNTAIYITSLNKDVTVEELFAEFSRFGVIAESIDDNKPRIKLYYNDEGEFTGDALIGEFSPRLNMPTFLLMLYHSLLPSAVGAIGHQLGRRY